MSIRVSRCHWLIEEFGIPYVCDIGGLARITGTSEYDERVDNHSFSLSVNPPPPASRISISSVLAACQIWCLCPSATINISQNIPAHRPKLTFADRTIRCCLSKSVCGRRRRVVLCLSRGKQTSGAKLQHVAPQIYSSYTSRCALLNQITMPKRRLSWPTSHGGNINMAGTRAQCSGFIGRHHVVPLACSIVHDHTIAFRT